MTPIEILATIFAILVLVKLLIIAIRPASWMKISEAILKKSTLTTISYLVLAVIVGYYVLASLNIVQVAAVMLLTSILIALGWVPYSNSFSTVIKDLENSSLIKSMG